MCPTPRHEEGAGGARRRGPLPVAVLNAKDRASLYKILLKSSVATGGSQQAARGRTGTQSERGGAARARGRRRASARAAALPLPRGAGGDARGSEHGGLRALPGAAGLGTAGRLRFGRFLPRLGLQLPRRARLGRGLRGVQLASRPYRNGLRLHPGHRCVRARRGGGGAGAARGRGAVRDGSGGTGSGPRRCAALPFGRASARRETGQRVPCRELRMQWFGSIGLFFFFSVFFFFLPSSTCLPWPGISLHLRKACEVCFPSQPEFMRAGNRNASSAALGNFRSFGSVPSGSFPRLSSAPPQPDPGARLVPEEMQHQEHRCSAFHQPRCCINSSAKYIFTIRT